MTRSIYPYLHGKRLFPSTSRVSAFPTPNITPFARMGLRHTNFFLPKKAKACLKSEEKLTRNNAAVLFILRQKLRMSIIPQTMNGARAGWFFAENMQTSLCSKWDFQVSTKQTNLICRDL